MTWYIDANAIVHATVYDGATETWREEEITVADALDAYSDEGCPAPADVEEVKHGEWILEREPNGKPYCFHCSVCDDDFHYISIVTKYPYCPNCGAKMDGKEKQND